MIYVRNKHAVYCCSCIAAIPGALLSAHEVRRATIAYGKRENWNTVASGESRVES